MRRYVHLIGAQVFEQQVCNLACFVLQLAKMKLNFDTISVALVVLLLQVVEVEPLMLRVAIVDLDIVEQDEQFGAVLEFVVVMLVVPGYLSAEFVVDLWTLMVETVHQEKSFAVLRLEGC